MNFTRKRIRGQNSKTRKTWMDDDGNYRVTWSKEIAGVRVEPFYHACVRTESGWGFAGRRGPYRTLKAAKEACEFNKSLWDKFLAVAGRTKVTQVRDLKDRSMVGAGKAAVSAMSDVPSWVLARADLRLIEIVFPTRKGAECDFPDAPTETSKSSDSPMPAEKPTKKQSNGGGGKRKRSTSTTKPSKPSRRKNASSSSDTE